MRRTRKLIPDFSVAGLAVVSEVTQVVLQNHMSWRQNQSAFVSVLMMFL